MKPILKEVELTKAGPARRAPRRGRRTVLLNLAESPLGWLHARGLVSDGQLAAGECLRRDWEWAQLSPGVTMRWEEGRVQGGRERGLNPTERQISARQRFDGAIAAAGPGLSDILWRVVCAGESVPNAERALAWPVRSGKLVLKLALDRVAAFYRIPG
ncbi:DUF6456 domain-containing protein [Novosphingobium sp. B 225]|uniref:DUF6456 domain-containing protein n=1 Tax=Novosphingobium sp. B 225 TaxID=1961849 RepID=UPI000B4AFA5C|nr:DUF6456 domain-containing protein [Novosphingobium sp. B 225]